MINLLPPDDFRELHAARHNILIVRLLIGALICFVGTVFVVSSSYILINVQKRLAETAKIESETQLNQYGIAKRETKDFKNNLTIAKQILDKNISYRTMLINIAQVLPDDSVVTALQLTPTMINTPTTLTISTTSYEQAVKIKDSLNASKIARDVSLGGVSTNTTAGSRAEEAPTDQPAEKYPVTAQLNLTFTSGLLTPAWNEAPVKEKS